MISSTDDRSEPGPRHNNLPPPLHQKKVGLYRSIPTLPFSVQGQSTVQGSGDTSSRMARNVILIVYAPPPPPPLFLLPPPPPGQRRSREDVLHLVPAPLLQSETIRERKKYVLQAYRQSESLPRHIICMSDLPSINATIFFPPAPPHRSERSVK